MPGMIPKIDPSRDAVNQSRDPVNQSRDASNQSRDPVNQSRDRKGVVAEHVNRIHSQPLPHGRGSVQHPAIARTPHRIGLSLLPILALLLGAVALTGCESSEATHARKMMWYRQPAKTPGAPMAMTVGRAGSNAEYDTWPAGPSVSGMGWEIGGTTVDRYGESATYSTWTHNDVGGPPIPNSGVSARSGLIAGTTLGVQGRTSTTGSWTGTSATYGTTP